MKIGPIFLDNPTVFAPMAGITNLPMRLLAKSAGCALVCSEMISANGLMHDSVKTWHLLASLPEERPLSVQLFGSDPALIAQAAVKVQEAGADIVDLNFGCSVKKILKSGSGSALMREPHKAVQIITAVRKAVTIPLTIKMRSGWDNSGDQALELARIAQESGVDAVTVHPRTARQGFTGRADWSLIGRVKAALHIPVIGNGDIINAEDAERMLAETGCDAVMVGRAAIANPFLFTQIRDLLAGLAPGTPDPAQRFELIRRYIAASVAQLGETHACLLLRSRLGWFVKGFPQAGQFRNAIRHLTAERQARELLDAYEAQIMGHCAIPHQSF